MKAILREVLKRVVDREIERRLEDDETLHEIWWVIYSKIEPYPTQGKLRPHGLADLLKQFLIKGEQK